MDTWRVSRTAVLLAGILAVFPAVVTADWQAYEARYAVYRNGKLAGKADFTVEKTEDGEWRIRSDAAGTHGMARLLRARDFEEAVGRLRDGRFWPQRFVHRTTVAGIDDEWTADFDWSKGEVRIAEGRERRTLDIDGYALDGLSLKVEMQRRLRSSGDGLSDEELLFHLVDDDEIKRQQFRLLETERLETSLGCLDTVPVERVRSSDSKRYTRAWHAPTLDFVTVRLEHGKIGGNHMEMRITELVLDGRPVRPRAGCTGYRAGP